MTSQPDPLHPEVDLSRAVVVVPPEWRGPRVQAARMLVEEVEARSGLRWTIAPAAPGAGAALVVLAEAAAGGSSEGYRISAPAGERMVRVEAAGERGVLFGIGGLLRALRLSPGRVALPAPMNVETAPRYPLRGHQLGYRPKNNTYDAWSPERFERYIRDLALFGANTIELLPPRTDDADTNALMRTSKEEMLAGVTGALGRYGLSAGLWYPLMEADYGDPDTQKAELAAAAAVFGLCARLDHVFVPTGDPGHTAPAPLCDFLAPLADVLRGSHPGAGLWISGQGFRPPELAELFRILRSRRPEWLAGMVYGPWTACTLAEMREAVPDQYPLRLYPDISHTVHCQFPVADWDPAFMATLGREPINPLPLTQAQILRAQAPGTPGFVTYSEGVTDDVNKFVWTALGWDPDADVGDVLRQYARVLVSPRLAEGLAQALLSLERNWRGPLLANPDVGSTLSQLQAVERRATADDLGNWRLQAALYRGYYDAYVRRRLIAAVARRERARDWIAQAPTIGAEQALQRAGQALVAPAQEAVPQWRSRIYELADQLFASIGLQLSVARHGASGRERGANLEALDVPLGEGPWLEAELAAIAKRGDEAERSAALVALDRLQCPAPGGFLDDLGRPGAQPHLATPVRAPYEADFLRSAWMVPTPSLGGGSGAPQPRLWHTAAETLYGVPLVLEYRHLDPSLRYRVRVLYHGRYRSAVTLEAGGLPVHGPLRPQDPPAPVAFPVPSDATAGGRLTLTWRLHDGRGIQVAAVWLEPAPAAEPD